MATLYYCSANSVFSDDSISFVLCERCLSVLDSFQGIWVDRGTEIEFDDIESYCERCGATNWPAELYNDLPIEMED
ncbi:MAG: hypothetical protein C4521_02765 [Actinobacteria bacterium]|nr:MAG: hypothetical protein C4521_02765 [Actinomycetota bacterium]